MLLPTSQLIVIIILIKAKYLCVSVIHLFHASFQQGEGDIHTVSWRKFLWQCNRIIEIMCKRRKANITSVLQIIRVYVFDTNPDLVVVVVVAMMVS